MKQYIKLHHQTIFPVKIHQNLMGSIAFFFWRTGAEKNVRHTDTLIDRWTVVCENTPEEACRVKEDRIILLYIIRNLLAGAKQGEEDIKTYLIFLNLSKTRLLCSSVLRIDLVLSQNGFNDVPLDMSLNNPNQLK